MKQLFPTLLLICGLCQAYAQDYSADFAKASHEKDTLAQRTTLKRWEKAKPKDAELFPAYFNYYVSKARKEVLSLTAEKPQGESYELKDSLDHTAGYIGGGPVSYDEKEVGRGLQQIDKGIALYPDRLDMRFGKAYVAGMLKNWPLFTETIVSAIERSSKNDNKWTWTGSQPRPDGKDFFLSTVQQYQYQLYNERDNALLPNIRQIAEAVLKYYPNHVESLSDLAVTYLLNGDYDKALPPLLKAEKIDPKDTIVLNNIATAYAHKGDKQKAIAYYEKIVLVGDYEAKEDAKSRIAELK